MVMLTFGKAILGTVEEIQDGPTNELLFWLPCSGVYWGGGGCGEAQHEEMFPVI